MKLFGFLSDVRQLDEARADRYRAMFGFVDLIKPLAGVHVYPPLEKHFENYQGMVDNQIRFAISANYSAGFLPWFFRWCRLSYVSSLTHNIEELRDDVYALLDNPDGPVDDVRAAAAQIDSILFQLQKARVRAYNEVLSKLRPELQQRLANSNGGSTGIIWANDASANRLNYKHFFDSQHLPNTQQFNPEGYTPDEVRGMMVKIEQDYEKENAGMIPPHLHVGNMLVSLPDGSAWFDLEKPGCSVEAQAMGHCGNGAGQEGQTVLSYRVPHRKGDKTFWKPHLTFILDTDNGMLGEMKGRNNDKPVPKYHKAILALLKLPQIRGIRGGGYLPAHNFSLSDLSAEDREELARAKPGMAGIEDALIKYTNGAEMPEQLVQAMRDELNASGLGDSTNPMWSAAHRKWVLYAHKTMAGLIDELWGSSSLAGRTEANELNFDDSMYNWKATREDLEHAWDHLDETVRGEIDDNIETKYADSWMDWIKDHFDREQYTPAKGENYGQPSTYDGNMVFLYIIQTKHPMRRALEDIAYDAARFGMEKEADSALNHLLLHPSRQYRSMTIPNREPGLILVDGSDLAQLYGNRESLDGGSSEGWKEWLSLEDDIDQPRYGWGDDGPDWETAMEMSEHHIAEALG